MLEMKHRLHEGEDECSCGCGHHHDHEEHHEHHHHDECGCGCGHHHHHDEEDEHEGRHHGEHHHHHEHHHTSKHVDGNVTKKVYILENLGCANCAAKMESKINALPDVADAVIVFATKQLRLEAKNPDALIPEIQKICTSIESEVVLKEKDNGPAHKESDKQLQENKKEKLSENAKNLMAIICGAVLFAVGVIISHTSLANGISEIIIFVIAYLLLGGEVVLTAVKNLFKGQAFDENFLMSVATLGAFAVKEWPEAVGVMLFYRIGEFFEEVAVERSRSQIMDAVDMRPEVVNLVDGEDARVIPAEDANVGEILLVRAGDRIPLDGTVIEGESRIDTSPVTGEPVPVQVGVGSELISGCVNTSGVLKIRVEKILEESMVTRILNSVENAAASKPTIDRFITRFARI